MKKYTSYLIIFGSLSFTVILLFDFVLMPGYIRKGAGRYMINVTGKSLLQAEKVLSSEGYKSLVSDTLYTASYEAGTIIDQYPTPNTKVKKGRTVRLKICLLYTSDAADE